MIRWALCYTLVIAPRHIICPAWKEKGDSLCMLLGEIGLAVTIRDVTARDIERIGLTLII